MGSLCTRNIYFQQPIPFYESSRYFLFLALKLFCCLVDSHSFFIAILIAFLASTVRRTFMNFT